MNEENLYLETQTKYSMDNLISNKSCPYCDSKDFVKYGKTALNRQRLYCNDCKRTFIFNTNTVFSNSKLEPSVWLRAIECLDNGMSLRKMSAELGVSLKTCQNLKKKITEMKKDGEISGE